MNEKNEQIIKPASPNPSTREIQTAHGLSAAISADMKDQEPVPDWLPGLVLALNDPHMRSKFRTTAKLLAGIGHIPPEPAGEEKNGWDGRPQAGILIRRALIHAEELRELVPLQFSRELVRETSRLAGAGGDPSGNPETRDAWERLPTAIRWAAAARDYLENEAPTPDSMRAVDRAQLAQESLSCAQLVVDEELERRRNLPGTKQRGRKLYYEHIQQRCGAAPGQLVVIDVLTGEYEVDDHHGAALRRLVERCPEALTWTERFGSPSPSRTRSMPDPGNSR